MFEELSIKLYLSIYVSGLIKKSILYV